MQPSLWVAIGLLAAFTIICVVVLRKFTADECLKIIGLFTGFFGLSFGAFCGYFFNRNEVLTAQRQATEYRTLLASVARNATEAKASLTDAVNSKPATYTVAEFKADTDYKDVLRKLNSAGAVYGWSLASPNEEDKPGGLAAQKK